MKKLKILPLCLAMSILAGCGSAVPMTMTLPAQENVTYTVETRSYEQSVKSETGELLAECRFALPQLLARGEDGKPYEGTGAASEVTAAFNAKFEDWQKNVNFEEMAADAQLHYDEEKKNGQPWDIYYTFELNFTSYQTEGLVSIAAVSSAFTGGAHPNSVLLGWNYDLAKKSFLNATELAGDGQKFIEAVTAELARQMAEISPDNGGGTMYWENYKDIIADWPNYAVTFDEEGMRISFSAYELAPYAAGAQIFTISYDFLKPYLSDYGQALLQIS